MASKISPPTEKAIFRAASQRGGAQANVVPIAISADDAEAFSKKNTSIKGKVETSSATKSYMYFRSVYGWQPRIVSSNSLGELLDAGVLPYCGDCGSNTCCINTGENVTENNLIDGNPNHCEKKEHVKLRRCPVCHKRIFDYDVSRDIHRPPDDDEEEYLIEDEAYKNASPEVRTKARLDNHIRYYHPTEAQQFGIPLQGIPELIRAV